MYHLLIGELDCRYVNCRFFGIQIIEVFVTLIFQNLRLFMKVEVVHGTELISKNLGKSIFDDIIDKTDIIIDNDYIDGYLKILESL